MPRESNQISTIAVSVQNEVQFESSLYKVDSAIVCLIEYTLFQRLEVRFRSKITSHTILEDPKLNVSVEVYT